MFHSILRVALVLADPSSRAEEVVDQSVIARIKMEGFQRSQVMDVLFHLTDANGPRLHDYVREEDLKQAAVIVASVAYLTAMRDEKLPRKPLPAPRTKK